ncbi:MAG: glycosyltransferase family 2 protein [Candidatus Eremiobacteraeota bacterium]|nr:glycosyltransferase family 2 protein [Candidatus Eremiobacteraeota bacterium]
MTAATYILPIRLQNAENVVELGGYLQSLNGIEIVVIDGSDAATFAALDSTIGHFAKHLPADARHRGSNGKACAVLSGLAAAEGAKIIVADDDVRYDAKALGEVLERLDDADIVRPQNYFRPAPWHAVLDGARSLINRALDGDWPGTLAFRREALPFGYRTDVLFENFQLVRTIRARGGRELVCRDVFVRRLPPTFRHFLDQRVRQAYDEFARPARLIVALAILPIILVAAAMRSWIAIEGIVGLALALASFGWLRGGAFRYFSIFSVLAAPLWVMERAVCSWLALYERVRFGGVRYAGTVIATASRRPSELL